MSMSDVDLMHKIATHQEFDGSYALDANLCQLIRVNYNSASQKVSSHRWNSKAFAVTLVLAFFREKLEKLQDDWELIADKSRIWLLDNAASQADAMFDNAVNLVKGGS